MKVLHVVPAAFGENGIVGGAERYALELARHMAEEVDTTLATFGAKSTETYVGRLRLRTLGRTSLVRGQAGNPIAPGLLREILRADIVHCHQRHVLASSLSALAGRVLRKPVFVTDLGGGGWDLSAYVKTDRWFDGHLHISEYSRRIHEQDGLPWAHVILGGVDTKKFSPAPDGAHDGTVVFVGRLLAHKGVTDLIDGLPSKELLTVIGRPYDPAYFAVLSERALDKNVEFRQGVDDVGLVAAYRQALCVVLPSVYRSEFSAETLVPELLGQTLLEGMACGAPAICTNVASMPEIVEDGISGFVVPPNDPETLRKRITWLRANPARRREMGASARERVTRKFQWESVVDRCLKIYSEQSRA